MRIGYVWKEPGAGMIETDDDDDIQVLDPNDDGNRAIDTHLSKTPFANKLWHVAARSSPYNTSVSVTYGCDLFVRSPEVPLQSRIMHNGEAGRKGHPRVRSSRGVRMEIEVDVNLDLSLGGVMRGVRRVGDFTTIGVGVGLNPQRGLFISFSWSRLGQNIIIPVILLSEEEFNVTALLWALAVPWVAYAAVEFTLLRPKLRRQRRRLFERKRRELREMVVKRRTEAEQAVLLMAPLVEHRQAVEREQEGLVILKATYGVSDGGSDFQKGPRAAEVANVMVALAALVNGGQLSIARGLNKSQIIGFWDPAPLKRKRLIVDYLFGGRRHHVEVANDEALSMPMRMHEV
jgi:DnaJ family protein C protein 11